MKYHDIKLLKQKFRREETPSEQLLWKHLRRRQLKGRKFLRQHAIIYESIGNEYFFFVPDFYCYHEKLAIELDGKIHEFRKAKDKNRDAILNELGITVLRIKNEELQNIQRVLNKISSCFKGHHDDPPLIRKSRQLV
jgi:very-short-patch-repair endonuclease